MSINESNTGRKVQGKGLIESLVKSLTESDQAGESVNAMLNVAWKLRSSLAAPAYP